ncbi:MAG: hypothetical protein OXP68_01310 [Anaerolineaceae bacterium]|nr:hypothetical protein [Anaerolineaceae bacterium]MDE0328708.1 hypothetical protein [Anaerolineaceae bacterium]
MQFKIEWDDREVRKMLDKLPGDLIQEVLEQQLSELRMKGERVDEILVGSELPMPNATTVGGVVWRESNEIPADQVVFQRHSD